VTGHEPATVTRLSRPDIDITVPADGAYLSVLRTAAAGLAARLDFTLDDIEDLRVAVDEACSILLAQASDGRLRCTFTVSDASLTVAARVPSHDPRPPTQDGFAWTVLTALATKVEVKVVSPSTGGHDLVICLTHARSTDPAP